MLKSLMDAKVFDVRPMDDKTIQYCVNDVIHLPQLHALYLRRMEGDWLEKAKEQSAKRVVEAHSPSYEPQSEKNKLGPWGVSTEAQGYSIEDMFDRWANRRMDDLYDDMVGYYNNGYNDDWGGMNATNGPSDRKHLIVVGIMVLDKD